MSLWSISAGAKAGLSIGISGVFFCISYLLIGWPLSASATVSLFAAGLLITSCQVVSLKNELLESEDNYEETIQPVTGLLMSHLDLISETTENVTLELSLGLNDVQKKLCEIPIDVWDTRPLITQTEDLHFLLQTQDIVRQQVEVVRYGLGVLEPSLPPQTDFEGDWNGHALETIKGSYVMQTQYDVHHVFLGLEPEDKAGETKDALFF